MKSNDQIGKEKYQLFLERELKVQDIQFTKDKYCHLDCIYLNNGLEISEIKYRPNYSSSRFNDILLEYPKYKSMQKASKTFSEVHYVMIFNDDVLIDIPFSKMKDLQWTEKVLPTDENKVSTKKKLITYIPISLGNKYYLS